MNSNELRAQLEELRVKVISLAEEQIVAERALSATAEFKAVADAKRARELVEERICEKVAELREALYREGVEELKEQGYQVRVPGRVEYEREVNGLKDHFAWVVSKEEIKEVHIHSLSRATYIPETEVIGFGRTERKAWEGALRGMEVNDE